MLQKLPKPLRDSCRVSILAGPDATRANVDKYYRALKSEPNDTLLFFFTAAMEAYAVKLRRR